LNGGQCIIAEEQAASSSIADGSAMQPAIIGAIIGGAVLLIAAAVVVFFVVKRKRQRSTMSQPMSDLGLQKSNSTVNLLSPPPASSSSFYSPSSSPASSSPFNTYKAPPPGPWAPQNKNSSFSVRPAAVAPSMPPRAAPQFTVGMQCQAKYSADGRFYKAVIEDSQQGQFLVHYVDFGEDREWVPASSLK
jgi:hypothetical protein